MAKVRLDRELALTAAPGDPEARAVEAGDPAARYVLGGPGTEIEAADAERYGVAAKAAPKEAESEPEPEPEAKAAEMGTGGVTNKAVTRRNTK
jgi:hypothetical protein